MTRAISATHSRTTTGQASAPIGRRITPVLGILVRRIATPAVMASILFATAAHAQNADAPPDTVAAPPPAPVIARAGWLSDRVTLRIGDILTVLVDEQTAARERVSRTAGGSRQLRSDFRASINGDDNTANIGSGIGNDSRDVGEANRQGDLTAVLSVRVTAIDPDGTVQIAGSKKVSVDGRLQEVALKGSIRPQDISQTNTVLSSRIADAVITYKGKKIGPRTGIIGKILTMLWP